MRVRDKGCDGRQLFRLAIFVHARVEINWWCFLTSISQAIFSEHRIFHWDKTSRVFLLLCVWTQCQRTRARTPTSPARRRAPTARPRREVSTFFWWPFVSFVAFYRFISNFVLALQFLSLKFNRKMSRLQTRYDSRKLNVCVVFQKVDPHTQKLRTTRTFVTSLSYRSFVVFHIKCRFSTSSFVTEV